MKTLKKYERWSDIQKTVEDGRIQLAWSDILLDKSEILYSQDDFTDDDLAREFDIKTGTWYTENGWIVGKNPEMNPGMIVSKRDFFGSVMLEITAKMVAPSTHDINMMINGEWDDEKGRGNAYVAGMEAFWHGNIGFEKSPEYKLTAATSLIDFDPEREYIFRLGNADGKLFVMVDDKVALEICDPDPIDSNKYGKIGFEAFASWWKFKNLRVYKLCVDHVREYYVPEF